MQISTMSASYPPNYLWLVEPDKSHATDLGESGMLEVDGVLLLGPFNCLPFRISEAILKPLCVQHGLPI